MTTTTEFTSPFKGSEKNYQQVRAAIEARWPESVDEYDPYKPTCLTYRSWLLQGFKVRKNEHGIRIMTLIEKRDKTDGAVLSRYPRNITLFFKTQVEKIKD